MEEEIARDSDALNCVCSCFNSQTPGHCFFSFVSTLLLYLSLVILMLSILITARRLVLLVDGSSV